MTKSATGQRPDAVSTLVVSLVVFLGLGLLAGMTMAEVKHVDPVREMSRDPGNLVEHSALMVNFRSKVLLKRDRTQVIVPFTFSDQIQVLMLGFVPIDGEARFDRLISHPFLMDLNWSKKSDDLINLYQREEEYSSVEEFLDNPPEINRIAVDGHIMDRFPNLKDAVNTYTNEDLSRVDFVLTTFSKPDFVSGVWFWEGVVDATKAKVDEGSNSIDWYIRAPLADLEKKYQLGNIKIEYLQ